MGSKVVLNLAVSLTELGARQEEGPIKVVLLTAKGILLSVFISK